MGGKVYLLCRRMDSAAEAKCDIIQNTGNSYIETLYIDLSNFKSIKDCAEELERKEPNGIHVLINNAGLVTPNDTKIQNIMKIFVVNHLGPFLLTTLLLPLLKRGSSDGSNSRVVVVSSGAADLAALDLDRIDSPQCGSFRAYANSKLANLMYSNALARKLEHSGEHTVVVNAVHPGWVRSELDRNANAVIKTISRTLNRLMAKTSKEGAQTSVMLATDPHYAFISGKYFENCAESRVKNKMAYDTNAQEILWEKSQQLINNLCDYSVTAPSS